MQTERLDLRQWMASDRAVFAALNADPEVMKNFPSTLTRAESDAMTDRLQAHIDAHGWGLWALAVRATGEFIGFTGLAVPRFDAHFTPAVEVGWRLTRSAWGTGTPRKPPGRRCRSDSMNSSWRTLLLRRIDP